MQWLNEPASWQRAGDEIKVSADPGTDFWRETGYGYVHDSGHVYGEMLPGDLDVSVRVRPAFTTQYDQAGIMLLVDEQTWLKAGLEFFEGRPRLSTVLTLGRSSWMVADLPEDLDEITLRASRRGDAVEVRYSTDGASSELAALAYLPPGRELLAGVMCAAPDGAGFGVTFRDLRIVGREWTAAPASGEAGGWPGPLDEAAAPDWPGESGGDWPEPGEPAGGEPAGDSADAGEAAADWAEPAGADGKWPGQAGADGDWGDTGEAADDWAQAAGSDRAWPGPDHGTSGAWGEPGGGPGEDWAEPAAAASAGAAGADWAGLPTRFWSGEDGGLPPAVESPAGPEEGQPSEPTAERVAQSDAGAENAAEQAGPDLTDLTDPGLASVQVLAPEPTPEPPATPAAKVPPPRSARRGLLRRAVGLRAPVDPAEEWISLLTGESGEE